MMPSDHLKRINQLSPAANMNSVQAFLVVHNEIERLPSVLDHHRSLGIERFCVVDNGSDDGTCEFLLDQRDVLVYATSQSFWAARCGMEWIEILLTLHGEARWCLILDADEFFTYPDCGDVSLPRFCNDLERRGLNSLATMALDMYSDKPILNTKFESHEGLLGSCAYFDREGYFRQNSPNIIPAIVGGPRARLFWPEIDLAHMVDARTCVLREEFNELPRLTQIPLVKWNRNYSYPMSRHKLLGSNWRRGDTVGGILLHFRMAHDMLERAVSAGPQRASETRFSTGNPESLRYSAMLKKDSSMNAYADGSVLYTDSSQLVELGLVCPAALL